MLAVESLILIFIRVTSFFVVVLYRNFAFYFKLQSVNVDAKDKKGGFTAVMLAAMNEHRKVK